MLIPTPIAKALSMLPTYPGAVLFTAALNFVLKERLPSSTKAALTGKKIRIHIIDAGVRFDFQWTGAAFAACTVATPDLTIAATAHDFLLLAQRKEDPDTLFFSRRLAMEGDTELGLLVKNTLDAIELPVFELGKIAPARLLARLKK